MSDEDPKSAQLADQSGCPLPMWRRVLSIAIFCVAFVVSLPLLVSAWGLAMHDNATDRVGLVLGFFLLGYPAIILLAIAAIIRWHKNPKRR